MMVEFVLDRAHPAFIPVIRNVIHELCDFYPWVKLDEVSLYERKPDDRSMGNANFKAKIALNPYWFSEDPTMIKAAGLGRRMMPIGNGKQIPYHGEMVNEPRHLLTHEFGHTAADSMDQEEWVSWAIERWREALRDTSLAPSGYGLTNPVEYFAELFAATHLGFADGYHGNLMRDLLTREENRQRGA